jgi:hypothetical protein
VYAVVNYAELPMPMPVYRIKNGSCKMEYDTSVDDVELAEFTANKNLAWDSIGGALDRYIADEIQNWLEVAAGRRSARKLPAAAREVLRSGAYITDIANDVYEDVNKGLALIWKSETVKILDPAPYSNVIGDDHFNVALTKLYRRMGVSSYDINSKVKWSRIWVDACAYRMMRAYSPKLVKR